ncbi:hypothetical protein QE152_g11292 [Popillia japonica]|uniref:Uncharacterized protein n=1 Tax=Popillia japonica TaxID=7064 RepID=A0AAW1LKZ2_POPJA
MEDPVTNKILISRVVRFDENGVVHESRLENKETNEEEQGNSEHRKTKRNMKMTREDNEERDSDENGEQRKTKRNMKMTREDNEERDSDENGEQRLCDVTEKCKKRQIKTPGKFSDYELYCAYCFIAEEPTDYEDALERGNGWKEAINNELKPREKYTT